MPGRNTGQEKVFAFSIVYLTGCTPFYQRCGVFTNSFCPIIHKKERGISAPLFQKASLTSG